MSKSRNVHVDRATETENGSIFNVADGDSEAASMFAGTSLERSKSPEPVACICLETRMPARISTEFLRILLNTIDKAKASFGKEISFQRIEVNEYPD